MSEEETKRAVASFRQRGGFVHSKGREGGKKKSNFVPGAFDRFQLSTEYNDEFRFIPGEYTVQVASGDEIEVVVLENFIHLQHYLNKGNTGTYINCSAGPFYKNKKKREPCPSCDMFWDLTEWSPAGKVIKKSPMGSARMLSDFTVIHFHPYHLVEQMRDGKPVPNPSKQGEYYMNWVRCEDYGKKKKKCKHCKDDRETVKARKLHLSLGPDHMDSINNYQNKELLDCLNCGSGPVETEAWVCPNAECGYVHVDIEKTDLEQEQIDDLVAGRVVCPDCGTYDFPKEELLCNECGKNGKRVTLFDVNIKATREGNKENNQTKLVVRSHMVCPIPEEFKDLAVPMQLNKIFRPDTIEQQEEKIGRRRPAHKEW
jgi:hypothetical protein